MAKAHSMNMTAHHVVAFDRTLAAPRGPKAVWLPAPPKAPARSAALPLWSNTTMMSTRQFKTKSLRAAIQQSGSRGQLFRSRQAGRTPTSLQFLFPYFPSINKTGITDREPALLEIYNRSKRLRVEACAAHERAVQFFLRHQSLNIVRLDAAAIENPQGRGERDRESLSRAPPK